MQVKKPKGGPVLLIPRLLSGGRYLILLAVLSSFAASVAILLWGTARMFSGISEILAHLGAEGEAASQQGVHMIALLDAFLLAVVLYIFAVALYELFIGEVTVPSWLVIRNLDDLKRKLISVIIMVMAVTFLEHLVRWEKPLETLMFGAATALVLAALILFLRLSGRDHH